jgi:hypothetical protein
MSTVSEVRDAVQAIALLLDQHYERVEASNATTRNAVRSRGARTEPVVAGSDPVRVSSSVGTLAGFSLRETTGAAPAVVELRDSQSGTDGTLVSVITLTAGESVRDWFGADGPSFSYGLIVVRVSGSVDGAVYLGTS